MRLGGGLLLFISGNEWEELVASVDLLILSSGFVTPLLRGEEGEMGSNQMRTSALELRKHVWPPGIKTSLPHCFWPWVPCFFPRITGVSSCLWFQKAGHICSLYMSLHILGMFPKLHNNIWYTSRCVIYSLYTDSWWMPYERWELEAVRQNKCCSVKCRIL